MEEIAGKLEGKLVEERNQIEKAGENSQEFRV